MKNIVLIFIIGLLLSNIGFAQNTSTNNEVEIANRMTQKLTKELNLNKEQIQKVEAINLEVMRKITLAKKHTDKNIMQTKIRAANTYRDEEFKKVLTPEQYNKLKSKNTGRGCRQRR